MIWYLIICITAYSDSCERPTTMPSKAACEFVAKQYRAMPQKPNARCVGVKS